MIEAELYDGTVLEFPDGTDPTVIQRVVKEQTAQKRGVAATELPAAPQAPAAQQAQAQSEPGWLDSVLSGANYAGGVLDQGARGVAEGVVRMVTLPQAAGAGVNWLADRFLPETAASAVKLTNPLAALPSADDMLAAGDRVNQSFADTVGVEGPRGPRNLPEHFANRVGQEVGAAALPTAGILAKAATTTPQAAREGGRLSRMFIEPAAVNPSRFLRNEVQMAVGAGTGAATATAMNPDSQWADLLGALGGAGATAVGNGLLRSGGEVLGALFNRPNYTDDVVRNAVVDRIAEAAGIQTAIGQATDTTRLADDIATGPRIDRDLPGVQGSLADRTRNPGVAALEYSRQSGPNAGMFAQRRDQNAQAVSELMDAVAPQGSPAALRGELDIERNRRLMDAGVEAANAEDAARRAVAPLAPEGTPATRGNVIRSALEDAREAARAKTAAAYEQADIAGREIRAEDLIDTIEGVASRLTQAEQSRLPESLLNRIRSIGDNPATLKEATDLRSELLELRRAAEAAPGGRNEARVLSRLEEAVDGFIRSSIGPDDAAALDAARATRFSEAESFDRAGDPVRSALATYEGGRPRMRDENVARTFTNSQNMDRLLQEADTPQVRAAIRSELLSGVDASRADRIQEFMTTNAEQVKHFPGLREELERAATARASEADATARRAGLERELGTAERRGTSTVGKYLSYSDAQSDRAIREVLAARDPAAAANELLDFVGDSPQAVEGARKAFWNVMEMQSRRAGETTADTAGGQPWMGRALKRFLDNPANDAVAQRLYRDNPEHLANIKRIAEAMQGLDVRNAGKVPNNSGTAQSVLPSAETIASRTFAVQRGQVGLPFLALNLGAIVGRRAVRGARAEAIERLLDQSLLDPELAETLLRSNNPANRAALRRVGKTYLGNEANTILNLLANEEQQPDELMSAVEAPGMVEAGNIDLDNRPRVENADGSISTERSFSFEEDGKEVLIPRVSPSGTILTEEGAINLYRRTGKHLGKFDNPQDADSFADWLHQLQEKRYAQRR